MNPDQPEKTALRRFLSMLLILLGAAMILLAPESWPGSWSGFVLLALGVSVELIGMLLRHRDSQ